MKRWMVEYTNMYEDAPGCTAAVVTPSNLRYAPHLCDSLVHHGICQLLISPLLFFHVKRGDTHIFNEAFATVYELNCPAIKNVISFDARIEETKTRRFSSDCLTSGRNARETRRGATVLNDISSAKSSRSLRT
jgi:hypothetical protein